MKPSLAQVSLLARVQGWDLALELADLGLVTLLFSS